MTGPDARPTQLFRIGKEEGSRGDAHLPERCEGCHHAPHEPGQCSANVGTGYRGPVLCQCSQARPPAGPAADARAFAEKVAKNDDEGLPFAFPHSRIVPLARDYLDLLARHAQTVEALEHEWFYNHAEHCRNEWPHSGMCHWPQPAALAAETAEATT